VVPRAALAVDMLDEADLGEDALETDARDGRPQDNPLYRYLLCVRELGEEVEKAFCSSLTEYISTAADGCIWDVEGIDDSDRLQGLARARRGRGGGRDGNNS